MAPAQIIDVPQSKSNYNHKKFQIKRYSHKKFGNRENPSMAPPDNNREYIYQPWEIATPVQIDLTTECNNNNNSSNNTFIQNKAKKDIFRPYALNDSYSNGRKRKHQQMVEETATDSITDDINDIKKFAISSETSPMISPPTLQHKFPVLNHMIYQRLQQNRYDAQTFTVALQKQQAAISLGNILKCQPNFNLYNLIGGSITK